jgi:type II secretory pathway pseudopilin PulG
LIPLVVSLLKI